MGTPQLTPVLSVPSAVLHAAGPDAYLDLDQPVQCCELLAAAEGSDGEPLHWHWSLHHQGKSLETPGMCCWGRTGVAALGPALTVTLGVTYGDPYVTYGDLCLNLQSWPWFHLTNLTTLFL